MINRSIEARVFVFLLCEKVDVGYPGPFLFISGKTG